MTSSVDLVGLALCAACIGAGFIIAAFALVEKHGAWSGYSSCLIHHTPGECQEVKPP